MRASLWFGWLALVSILFVVDGALAFTPPPMTAHVTDTAGKLSEGERIALDRKLEDYRIRTSNQIAVFIPASLDGETIEDVGIATGRAWHIGVKGKDNGVLLIIAPAERKARIDAGKGSEGDLPDLKTDDIIQHNIKPHLRPGQEDYRAAIDDGTSAIMGAMGAGASSSKSTPAHGGSAVVGLLFLLLVFLVPFILFIVIMRAIVGAFTSHGPSAGRGWASGGTWSNDSSWSSSAYDSGWGGGGGGDSGFTGGGGDFGGGGSSDSF
jgi:uncharacterized protein